jgi:hypothetical protein
MRPRFSRFLPPVRDTSTLHDSAYMKYKSGDTLVRLPLVSVRISCNRKHHTFWALIDSRVEVSVFSKEVAEVLDVAIPTGNRFVLSGVYGGLIST